MHKFEAITICFGEKAAKFLDFTLPKNKSYFDRFIVVTSSRDIDTKNVCSRHGVTCVETDSFFRGGASFRKGAGYNEAFRRLNFWDFVCFLDCDIVIPKEFESVKNNISDKSYFYGARRIIIPKISDYDEFEASKKTELDFWVPYGIGYGFFGIFNVNSDTISRNGLYYHENDGVGESDWMFRNQFGDCINDLKDYTGKLKELPIKVAHLGMPGGTENIDFWAR